MEYKKGSGDDDEVEFDYVPDLEQRTRSGRQRKRPSFFQVIKTQFKVFST